MRLMRGPNNPVAHLHCTGDSSILVSFLLENGGVKEIAKSEITGAYLRQKVERCEGLTFWRITPFCFHISSLPAQTIYDAGSIPWETMGKGGILRLRAYFRQKCSAIVTAMALDPQERRCQCGYPCTRLRSLLVWVGTSPLEKTRVHLPKLDSHAPLRPHDIHAHCDTWNPI